MKIQYNTIRVNNHKTIYINEKDQSYFTSLIAGRLENYKANITQIEVQLSDKNEQNSGLHSMRCSLETSTKDALPLVIACQVDNDNIVLAVLIAVDKLIASLKTINGVKDAALNRCDSFANNKKRLIQAPVMVI